MEPSKDLIELIKWTMANYGSPAGEAAEPGSRLHAQATFIATTLAEYNEACMRVGDLAGAQVRMYWPGRK
jgi:hypothetical protein